MSKWRDNFETKHVTTNAVKKINQEIKEAMDKERSQKKIDKALSGVIKGKYKRSGS